MKVGLLRVQGALVNAGAYSHTSLAIRDAFSAVSVPFVEVHLSNAYRKLGVRSRRELPVALGESSGSPLDASAPPEPGGSTA